MTGERQPLIRSLASGVLLPKPNRAPASYGIRLMACLGLLVFTFATEGCANHRLQVKMLNQASALPNVYYQEVLNNLAMIKDGPARMPYFSDPQTACVGVQ